jgi:hypothetical protein
MSDWKLSFRYRKSSEITSESIPISDIKTYLFMSSRIKSKPLVIKDGQTTSQPLCWFMYSGMSDIAYRIKVYSDVRYKCRTQVSSVWYQRFQYQGSIRDRWWRILDKVPTYGNNKYYPKIWLKISLRSKTILLIITFLFTGIFFTKNRNAISWQL